MKFEGKNGNFDGDDNNIGQKILLGACKVEEEEDCINQKI